MLKEEGRRKKEEGRRKKEEENCNFPQWFQQLIILIPLFIGINIISLVSLCVLCVLCG